MIRQTDLCSTGRPGKFPDCFVVLSLHTLHSTTGSQPVENIVDPENNEDVKMSIIETFCNLILFVSDVKVFYSAMEVRRD